MLGSIVSGRCLWRGRIRWPCDCLLMAIGHNFILEGNQWGRCFLSVFRVNSLCKTLWVSQQEWVLWVLWLCKTPMMTSRTEKKSIIKWWFFESQTKQVKEREDLPKLIKLLIKKERLPQISVKYRGSLIFTFILLFQGFFLSGGCEWGCFYQLLCFCDIIFLQK